MSSSGEESSVIYDDTKESSKDYKPGGYHPVECGDLFLNRYLVVQKLGWGHFSTVWLCKDNLHGTYVAMKVQKSAPNYTEAALDEIDLLLKISNHCKDPLWATSVKQYQRLNEAEKDSQVTSDHCYVVQLLNTFSHTGENGTHICLVFEVLGVNLLEIIKFYQYKGVPIQLCRSISKQVLIGLDYLHRICGIIHTDLKPENVIVQLTQAQVKELFTKGRINTRDPLAVVVKEVKISPCMEIDEKKLRKIEKKKRLRKRKQELKKKMQAGENVEGHKDLNGEKVDPAIEKVNAEPNKKKKRKKKNKNAKTESVSQFNTEESLNYSEIDPNLKIKIADLGNACWVDHHFSTEIQTRQYRSPEVILGISYNHTADIWSFACMLFELLTGDFLFDPRSNENFDKDEDHLAQMIETIGLMSPQWALSGQYAKKLLNPNGELKNIKQLKIWLLRDVLIEKYRFKPSQADLLTSFLMPMLVFRPEKRISAVNCISHPWITDLTTEFRMSDEEYQNYINESEQIRVETIERYERNGYASSPEVPQEYSGNETDEEDNNSSGSCFSEDTSNEVLVIKEEDYHTRFNLY